MLCSRGRMIGPTGDLHPGPPPEQAGTVYPAVPAATFRRKHLYGSLS